MSEPGWEIEGGYRIDVFAEQDAVSGEDIIALWLREGGLSLGEAQRRLTEVLLVVSDARGQVVGVCTRYLHRNEQLRTDMWYVRGMVAAAHRRSSIGYWVSISSRDYLSRRFVSGEDRRGIGVVYEIENHFLKHVYPMGYWEPNDFIFIGETAAGQHVRVHYFPGA
ncbi:MAG TPA: hypothetical protein VIJ20_10470, partial [Solirubrobacteraceae bacterium]